MKIFQVMLLSAAISLGFMGGTVQGAGLQEPVIESEAAVVMDAKTGEILYEKNGTLQCYPASITKLLTALVTVDEAELSDVVIFSHDAVYDVEEGSGNPIQLEAGDKLTVEECLYAMILESSNQAANALAEHVAGSMDAFAIYMDMKLDELGCENSTFVNPSGLNDPEQMTTAEDMARIAQAAFDNPDLLEICSATEYTLPATLNNPNGYELHMEHQLLNDDPEYDYSYAVAGKTGYTSSAGNTLVTSAKKNDQELIAVVMKSEQTHYEDTMALLDYGFEYLEQNPAADTAAETVVSAEEPVLDDNEAATYEKESTESVNAPEITEKTEINWLALILGGIGILLFLYVIYIYIRINRIRRNRIQRRRRRAARARSERLYQEYQREMVRRRRNLGIQ